MKKILVLAVLLTSVTTLIHAQVKTAAKPAAPKPLLKNLNDSASYAIGMSVANFYKSQGITKISTALVTRAMNDVFTNKKSLLDDVAANNCMNSYMSKVQQQKSQGAIDSGAAFLKKNKTKPGVITTASGLQYEVITQGTGEKPLATDSVTCHYKGTLLNGVEFDNSFSRGQPITFALKGVIPGWTEALQLMSVGSKYKLYIPYTLGYGAFDYGPIPGGSMLTFEVELLEVRKGPAQGAGMGLGN
jgi:FKBP-type peptidyl-prolyl cis-trans isomerase